MAFIPSPFFVPVSGGRQLHGLIWRAANLATPAVAGTAEQTTNNVPLICAHGLTRNAFDFMKAGAALSQTRDVIALDMAGRGFSDWTETPLYNYATYVADCQAALTHLNLKQVDWLGTSMGGIIGMMLAAAPQSPIRRLALNDVGPLVPLSALKRIGDYVGKAQKFPDLAGAERYFRATHADFGIKDDAEWRRLTLTSVRRDGDGYQLHYDMHIADVFKHVAADVDMWPTYDSIRCPTLLLRGVKSDLLAADTAQHMTVRGPKAELAVIEGAGHAPGLTSENELAILSRFFG